MRIISKVSGDAARKLAEASAKILTRSLGGDPTLADEVQAIAAVQIGLAATDPNHPARIFGEAVEWRAQKQAGDTQYSAFGFDQPTSEFEIDNYIAKAPALTESTNSEQLCAHNFMSLVLKRKKAESAPTTIDELEACVDRESTRLKSMFCEIKVPRHKEQEGTAR